MDGQPGLILDPADPAPPFPQAPNYADLPDGGHGRPPHRVHDRGDELRSDPGRERGLHGPPPAGRHDLPGHAQHHARAPARRARRASRLDRLVCGIGSLTKNPGSELRHRSPSRCSWIRTCRTGPCSRTTPSRSSDNFDPTNENNHAFTQTVVKHLGGHGDRKGRRRPQQGLQRGPAPLRAGAPRRRGDGRQHACATSSWSRTSGPSVARNVQLLEILPLQVPDANEAVTFLRRRRRGLPPGRPGAARSAARTRVLHLLQPRRHGAGRAQDRGLLRARGRGGRRRGDPRSTRCWRSGTTRTTRTCRPAFPPLPRLPAGHGRGPALPAGHERSRS